MITMVPRQLKTQNTLTGSLTFLSHRISDIVLKSISTGLDLESKSVETH